MLRKRDLLVGIAILGFLAVCLIVPGLAAKKPQPAPVWSVEITPVASAEQGEIVGYPSRAQLFDPRVNPNLNTLFAEPSGTNMYRYDFRITIYPPSTQMLDFNNINIAERTFVNDEGVESELPGNIDGFLNDILHPDETYIGYPYNRVLLWFQLPPSEVDRIIGEGGSGFVNGGLLYISFYSDYAPWTSLFGTTTLVNLWVTTDGDNWTLEFNQPLDLKEQTTIATYYRNPKKPGCTGFLIQEVLTDPVHFSMSWHKVS